MSDNEQKAGCVDGLRELIAFVNGKCSNEEAGRKCLGFIMLHGAELEAALSPARSGEAVAWRVSVAGDWFFSADRAEAARERNEYEADCDGDCDHKEPEPLYLAPRNESSGVSPGGGDESWKVGFYDRWHAYAQQIGYTGIADALANLAMLKNTPAPQDSVRVGDGAEPAWRNIDTAEAEFLNNLAEKGGLPPLVAGMLRHCARLLPSPPDAGSEYVMVPLQLDDELLSKIALFDCFEIGSTGQEGAGELWAELLRAVGKPLTTPAPAAGADGWEYLTDARDIIAAFKAGRRVEIADHDGRWFRAYNDNPDGIAHLLYEEGHAYRAPLSDGAGQSAGGGFWPDGWEIKG